MTYGPSTTNAAMGEALQAYIDKHRDALTQDEFDLLDEAATRIEERGDEDE